MISVPSYLRPGDATTFEGVAWVLRRSVFGHTYVVNFSGRGTQVRHVVPDRSMEPRWRTEAP